jgi:hypothetical protein
MAKLTGVMFQLALKIALKANLKAQKAIIHRAP